MINCYSIVFNIFNGIGRSGGNAYEDETKLGMRPNILKNRNKIQNNLNRLEDSNRELQYISFK